MDRMEQSFMTNKEIITPTNIEQEKNNTLYDLDSLTKLNSEIINAVVEAEREVFEKMKERDETFKQKVKEARTAVFKKYIEKLKDEADRFGHIFETEKGSIYFVAQDGGSLRFKNTHKGLSRQPIALKTFFIDEAMMNEIYQECGKVKGDLCYFCEKNNIRTSELQPGAQPLELGVMYAPGGSDVVYTESEGNLKVHGTKIDTGEIGYGFIYHIGHKVTKVIK